ncbi:polysaccharide biosynthesis/export family protein [Hyunsoonleella pacifica]|uniref:Polysaccharide export protein n=1 Tax=Hyunsoonleella pacifica TaxID=1080224 RepID=A0A4Q9FQF8_9FLAO|nr:polysaccharide biosynthesis/export family protein [Hyunsoonleella pacifica]TBN17681.1 polysaccharide export protein [Hyunsoonleella pacifica]GGD09889.1 polysaccharide biosynthesis protein [Hyunsoonleella pacifica]
MFFNSIKASIIVISFLVLICFFSCASKRDVVYFQTAKDFETIVETNTFTPKLKINDIISVYVSTFDLEAVEPFNLKKGQTSSGGLQYIDYLIDKDGNIDYPVLGKIKLLGLSVEQAKELLKQKLSDYLKDPIVNIRILNFRIAVLGEVNRPGMYQVSGGRITLLEAIALAGDLKIKAKRENILVVRDFNGTKTYTRVDLTNKELFDSPVYFLTQNDVVYVEPNKSAITQAYFDGRVNVAISIASIIITSTVILLSR